MFSTLFRFLRTKQSDHRRTGRKRCRPALEALEDRLVPATVNWIGGSGNWTDTSHWDTGHVPTAADDAVIGVANVTVTLNGSHSVKSVSLISADATLVIEGSSTGGNATLTETGGSSNAGTIELTSAGTAFNAALSITGSGSSLTNTGMITALAGAGGSRTLTINNGAFSNQGTLSVGAGVNLALNEAFSATFTNTGTVGVAANQSLTISGGTFTNFSGGTLTGGTYDVAGTFQFSNAAITTDAANIILDGPSSQIVNQSNVNALANLATIAAGGSFTIQNGRNFTTAGTFRNFGALTVGNGSTFTDSGIFNQTGTLSILAGGTANLKDGSSSGAITNAGTVTITPNTAFIESGVYTQTGTLNVQGTLELDGGGSDSGNLANAGTWSSGAAARSPSRAPSRRPALSTSKAKAS
jgi:hypothetical protein